MTTEEDRSARLRRLQERRGVPTLPHGSSHPRGDEGTQAVAAHGAAVRRRSAEAAGAGRSGRHRAEASRVGAAGAGIVLTLSMMAGMARAERVPSDPAEPQGLPAAASEATVPPAPATTPAPIEVAPATAPATLVTVPVEQRVVVEPATPAAAPVPAPAPAPPPQAETASHGSR